MTNINDVYKCEKCGNIVEVTHAGPGALACCGIDMIKQEEKNADSTTEKHVPIIEAIEGGIRVTVGSTPHPMTKEHQIEWIEVINGSYVQRKFLKPEDKPFAEFFVPYSDSLIAREYCNVHGLWTSK